MSKVTDERIAKRIANLNAALAEGLSVHDQKMHHEAIALLTELQEHRADLEAASSTPDGEADSRTWFELREPGCVPERKGPMPPTMVAGFLRELFEHRPQAYVTVITMGQDGPLLQDGPECLQMIDGRSMNVCRRAIENQRAAHGAHPAPIKDGVTVKAEWPRYDVRSEGPGPDAHLSGMQAWGEIWSILRFDSQSHVDGDDGIWLGFFIDRNSADLVLSCLSHNAGEIEAGGEVGEPTRYDMVKMTGSLTLLPAVRADGEWVRYADHEASIASAIAGFDRLAATQNGIVHQITARAEASDKRIAELEATIRGLLRSEYESAEPGLTDCIDNTGTPYQSQYLADQIKLAEATLKESRL